MRYDELERRIHEMSRSATEASRRAFAIDTIDRLHTSAASALKNELTPNEYQLASYLAENFALAEPATLQDTLDSLNESMTVDDVRAIEFHPDITEWMCAIENWLAYLISDDPKNIAKLAVNMVNSIDYASGAHSDEYSTDNILGSPLMRAELERQIRILISGHSTV